MYQTISAEIPALMSKKNRCTTLKERIEKKKEGTAMTRPIILSTIVTVLA